MKIAFYKAKYGNYQDKIIALGTFSKYSHCELVFENGECASSSLRDGGVRVKYITLGEKWDVFDVNLNLDESVIRYWFSIHSDNKYDWPGAIGSAFSLDFTSEDKKFCSYCCASAIGFDPITTPGRLYKTLVKTGVIDG